VPTSRAAYTTIDEYIGAQPARTQKVLRSIRAAIRKAAPGATETINYGIPTFQLSGNLVHFAAFDKHIGFYPTPSGINAFKRELSRFVAAKGSVQFPLDQPMPLDLISRIVKFRVKEQVPLAGKKKRRK
jgi:uncharacterized protein YdhG (YjbR/CyaY superfamily)